MLELSSEFLSGIRMDTFLPNTDGTSALIATSVALVAYGFVSDGVIKTLFLPFLGP